jgi:hypothetical protein
MNSSSPKFRQLLHFFRAKFFVTEMKQAVLTIMKARDLLLEKVE